MRIFENFDEMYSEVGRDLKELGTWRKSHSVQNIVTEGDSQFDMMELIGYCFKLKSIGTTSDILSDDEMNYILSEMQDRFSSIPLNPGNAWKFRDKIWKAFLNPSGYFDYTYSERLCLLIPKIANELKKRPGTRQAVMNVFKQYDLDFMGGKRRIPCSLTYQFLVRDNIIHTIYSMRSCDYMTHFKFDVILAWLTMGRISDLAGPFTMGSLTMMIGSFHAFRKDLEKVF